MKQRICTLFLILLLLPSIILTAAAAPTAYVIDQAALLSDSEETLLLDSITALKDRYGMDVVILTLDSLHGSRPQDYADSYYDSNGYGDNGILFLLSMEERDWYISTCGEAIYALTDYGIQQLGEEAVWYLSDGAYYLAFEAFLKGLPAYLEAYASGYPIDGQADYSGSYYHGDQDEIVYYEEEFTPSIFLSLLIGAVVALIVVVVMRLSMNTKRPQHSAAVYLKDNSYHLTGHQDMFLYSNVSKVRKQQNTSGGGSSVHRSGGGRSHGGGGGKF